MASPLHSRVVLAVCLLALNSVRAQESSKWVPVGSVDHVARTATGVQLACTDHSTTTVTVLAADLIRVRTQFSGQPSTPDHSWAIDKTNWSQVAALEITEDQNAITLHTTELEVAIQRKPLQIEFRDAATHAPINADGAPMAWDPATHRVTAAKRLGLEERFYGLGEKAAPLEKRRGHFVMWNSDTPGYIQGTDPIYQSIPFYIGLEHGRAYGLFYDNSFRSTFDLGYTGQEYASYTADGGDLNYYFFYGPSIKKVVSRYTELTGRIPLPPLWTLGNQQSRYSYYPDSLALKVAELYRQNDLPLDVLYLDIHYMNGYRVFTWDPVRFPDPSRFSADLAKLGVKLVTIVDPGVKYQPPQPGAPDPAQAPELGAQNQSYYVYNQGLAGNHFLRRHNGELYLGEVWPGKAVFVDYTREDSRRWWGGLFRALLDHGVAGIWTDMNEPSDFVDKSGASQRDVVFDDLGAKSLYPSQRNLFALNMTRATYEGLARLQPDRRPFVITRAGYAGIQRYATVWTGDNNATWESLALNIPMFASMGLSGEAFVGADIPGFIGRASPELLVRSYQLGIFAPLLRNHAAIDNYDHEPWRFGPAYAAIIRKYLRLRYELLPFLYTTLEEAHRTGIPLFRPLVLNFPDDANTFSLDDEFMVGDCLLGAPITQANQRSRDVYLPAGGWYDFWTGAFVTGGKLVTAPAPLDQLPLWVRAGSVVPGTVAMNFVGEKPWDPVSLDVYPDENGKASGSLYEDDGVSPAYQQGAYRRTEFSLQPDHGASVLVLNPQGNYTPPPRHFEVRWHGAAPKEILLDGQPLPSRTPEAQETGWFQRDDHTAAIRLLSDSNRHSLEIR